MSMCLTTFDSPDYLARHARYGRPPRHARRRSRLASALAMASWAPLALAAGYLLQGLHL
jgi:hypothetical protein